MVSNVETTVAAKFRNLQELFPEADVVTMVERDSKVLFYDVENSIRVKVMEAPSPIELSAGREGVCFLRPRSRLEFYDEMAFFIRILGCFWDAREKEPVRAYCMTPYLPSLVSRDMSA